MFCSQMKVPFIRGPRLTQSLGSAFTIFTMVASSRLRAARHKDVREGGDGASAAGCAQVHLKLSQRGRLGQRRVGSLLDDDVSQQPLVGPKVVLNRGQDRGRDVEGQLHVVALRAPSDRVSHSPNLQPPPPGNKCPGSAARLPRDRASSWTSPYLRIGYASSWLP